MKAPRYISNMLQLWPWVLGAVLLYWLVESC